MTKVYETTNVEELIDMDRKHFIHPATNPKYHAEQGPDLIFEEGNGIYVKNAIDGKQYIDAMSMLWNVNLGHGNEELAKAGSEQLSAIACTSAFKGFSNIPAIELSKKLAELAPGDLNSVFFTSGGSESNDTAFKLARFYWGLKGKPEKRKFIALQKGYHGVTMAAQTATGIPAFHEFAGSQIHDVHHATAHLLESELGDKDAPNYEESIRGIIEREGADTIAGVIVEPVQGAGGVNIPPKGYLQAVRDLCDEYDILFHADEVITGFGRTGRMFGVDNWDVVPDMMSVAKGISSGYAQLGGVIVNDDIKQVLDEYDAILAHGFTYSAHPTACAIGLKNIEMLERDNVIEHVNKMEAVLQKGLDSLAEKHDIVTNTRVIGLLAAFDLYKDRDKGELFDMSLFPANTVVDESFDRQLIVRAVGSHNESIALAPPLIVTEEEINEIIDILDEAITAFKQSI